MKAALHTSSPSSVDATLVLAGVLVLASMGAMAGTDTVFSAASTFLDGALSGTLGKTFALGSLAVGLGVGIVKQSVLAIAVGIGMAFAASIGPGIMTGMFTAVI